MNQHVGTKGTCLDDPGNPEQCHDAAGQALGCEVAASITLSSIMQSISLLRSEQYIRTTGSLNKANGIEPFNR